MHFESGIKSVWSYLCALLCYQEQEIEEQRLVLPKTLGMKATRSKTYDDHNDDVYR